MIIDAYDVSAALGELEHGNAARDPIGPSRRPTRRRRVIRADAVGLASSEDPGRGGRRRSDRAPAPSTVCVRLQIRRAEG
jgi:hypothetical protein